MAPNLTPYFDQAGSPNADVSTPQGSTVQQAISLLYGQSLAKELLKVSIDTSASSAPSGDDDVGGSRDDQSQASLTQDDDNGQKRSEASKGERWNAEAFVTSPNYQAKRFIFLLFINRKFMTVLVDLCVNDISDRLVESARIKKSIEAAYSGALAKGSSPFIYLRYKMNKQSTNAFTDTYIV